MLFSWTIICFRIFSKTWTIFQQFFSNFKFHLWFELNSKMEFEMRYESTMIMHCKSTWLSTIIRDHCCSLHRGVTITHKPLYIFLKTATIPTYHGIFIAIPRYIAMQLPPFHFYDTHRHCHIALHDHIADIVFVAQPSFIIFIHVTLVSLDILVHCQRHSYRFILCSTIEL